VRSNLQLFVDRLTSRSVLSEKEQWRILSLPVRARQVRSNEDFVARGKTVDHVSYIAEGLVGRFDENRHGARQITALHIAGDIPNLHSVVQPHASSAMQALSPVTLLEVSHTALREAAAAHPAIAEAFWRDSMVDSAVLGQWLVNVGRGDAQARVAHLLCEMARRYKVHGSDGAVTFRLPMTQSHLADATGLTPVHVNRTLKKLELIGTTFRNRMVRIGEWRRLVAIGDFDPTYLQDELSEDERIRILK
jgi:CRP-like cAMP-binding protein